MKTGELLGKETEGVNQILPHKHKWAWDLYEQGVKNNWVPTDVPMTKDVQNWKSAPEASLSEDERLVIKRCLGFFAGSESLVANNLMTLSKYITDPECRQYMARQMYEECLHNHTVVYICDSLDLDINEVYEAYQTVPSIKAKDEQEEREAVKDHQRQESERSGPATLGDLIKAQMDQPSEDK